MPTSALGFHTYPHLHPCTTHTKHVCPGFKSQPSLNQVWWCMYVITAHRKWRQGDQRFKVILSYKVRLSESEASEGGRKRGRKRREKRK